MGDNGRFIKLKKEREGEINYNNFGSKMILIEYRGATDIDVYFEKYNWIAKNREYSEFIKKTIICPYERRTCNIGYIGEGKYKVKENGVKIKAYDEWNSMLVRCYDEKYRNRYPTYIDCEVCEEWHNFQNFAKWYEENYYEIPNEKMALDKDILFKGNKIYSPQTCIFVPQRINKLFTKRNLMRGNTPIGVSYFKHINKYASQCHNSKGELARLGYYNTSIEAFIVYKNFKERVIKQVADEYKDYIPIELYEAMYRYEVEIDD